MKPFNKLAIQLPEKGREQNNSQPDHRSQSTRKFLCCTCFALLVSAVGNNYLYVNSRITIPSFSDAPGTSERKDAEPSVVSLNSSDASILSILRNGEKDRHPSSTHSIDILVIGSKTNIDAAKTQRQTWASNEAVRHFFLSTEDDDTDPVCRLLQQEQQQYSNQTDFIASQESQLEAHYDECKKKNGVWRRENNENNLTSFFRNMHARTQWLLEKANPMGWVCAQRRFATSLTKIVELYATAAAATASSEAKKKILPDYFILADDDTYINIDHIVQQLIVEPARWQESGMDLESMMFPPLDYPVVTAGCRVDWQIPVTFPYGGYGTFFSRGSLEKLIQPLNCRASSSNATTKTSSNESSVNNHGSCQKILHKDKYDHPMSSTLGEERFFEDGDSLNRLFYKYSREVKHFCIHSDHFVGYMANFHNISRHTTTASGDWYDKQHHGDQGNRLHQLPRSKLYNKEITGNCLNEHICPPEATVCHRINSTSLRDIHSKAK